MIAVVYEYTVMFACYIEWNIFVGNLGSGTAVFVPDIYTAIAFDSGGVASGPMTATFLLPLAQGACEAVGGNIVTDAFGVVAMVAMTPLITLQVLGLVYQVKGGELGGKGKNLPADKIPVEAIPVAELFEELEDTEIIEL